MYCRPKMSCVTGDLPATQSRACCSSSSIAASPAPDAAWYVLTTMRRTPAAWCSGQTGTAAMMVLQFGLAMMPVCSAAACGFTSGTTSGTPGVMRNALELSITTAPASTAAGAKALDCEPPAAKKATSTPSNESSRNSRTTVGRPAPSLSSRPALRLLASRRSSLTGKLRSCRMRRRSWPTEPVAPATATVTPPLLAATSASEDRDRIGAPSATRAVLAAPAALPTARTALMQATKLMVG
mmetsp:Transcript_7269/g.25978  ORF Transcript_7269/g.25978 Transcript_7269/m.25978 type:complete len:240 (+) Transcript_7269:1946-2665(+)